MAQGHLEVANMYPPSGLLTLMSKQYMGYKVAPPPVVERDLLPGNHPRWIAVANAVLEVATNTNSFAFVKFNKQLVIDIAKREEKDRDWEEVPNLVLRYGVLATEAEWNDYKEILDHALASTLISFS